MKKYCLVLFIIFLANAIVYSKDIVKRHILPVLTATTARDIAMAGASFTCVDDSSSLFINPSMMANMTHSGIMGSYSYTPYGDHKTLLSYAQKIKNFTFGIGLQSFIASPINIYDSVRNKSQTVYQEHALTIGLAYKLDKVLIGGNIKGIYTGSFNEKKIPSKYGMTLDLGVTIPVILPAIRVSLGIKNLGFYQKTFAPIDTDIVAGLGIMTSDGLISAGIMASLSVPSITPSFALGGEFMIIPFGKNENAINIDDDPESILDAPPPAKIPNGIKVRIGVSDKALSFGAGLYVSKIRIDYAMSFEDYTFKYYTHSVSFGVVF